ncbi:hypothetical protein C0Q70_17867 [Pomacea canaliculata]|uniref:RING-type domain-containing protein n=1 Tax=Pomacea canaliculata TaxID=400727 RepID=A0A2T7NLM0_POMCA|nr:hypothetical protein C0Q70_17867 [Pomacea canaliculata]
MASSSAQPTELECAVCMNGFTTPKILQCGHLLCLGCVISWMDSKPNAGCPLCRSPIVEKQGRPGQSSADIADALPTDFVMEALVDSARVLNKDPVCCVCDGVSAEFICIQCQDMLCSGCAKAHKKFSSTRNHDVEGLSTVTPERLAASRPALCADHGDKHAKYFCGDHRLAVCLLCSFMKHKNCSLMREMDEEMKSAESSTTDLTNRLSLAEKLVEQAMAEVDNCLEDVDISEANDVSQVDAVCDRLRNLVEGFRNKLKEISRLSHSQVRTSLKEFKSSLGGRLGTVMSHKNIVARVRSVAPCPALIHATKTLTDRVNSLDIDADLEADVQANPSLDTTCYKDIVRHIEKDLQMLGRMKSDLQRQHLAFHANSGIFSTLILDKKIAGQKNDGLYFARPGVVASCRPVEPNVLYQVRVDKTMSKGFVYYGITETKPSKLDSLQKNYGLSRWRHLTIEKGLIGVMKDSSNHLHFYLDDQKIDTDTGDIPRHCYAVFVLLPGVLKVTLLPVVKIV